MNNNFTVLLFYKYIEIESPNLAIENQKKFLNNLNILGRIIISEEGINGTICGSDSSCNEYIKYMNSISYFTEIDYKKSYSDFLCFPKLIVKYKKEIAILGIDPKKISAKNSTKKISPKEFNTLVNEKINKNDINTIIFDTRNNYESKIGSFNNAIKPDIKNFRDLPNYFENNKDLFKDKNVIMFCTGGIRCERASALLDSMNISKTILHLNGGIHNYCEEFPNGLFRGRNYVFDDRISLKINNDVLSNCEICNIECNLYNNCLNALCNKHYICCNSCLKNLNSSCSQKCKNLTFEKKVPIRPPLPSRKEFYAN